MIIDKIIKDLLHHVRPPKKKRIFTPEHRLHISQGKRGKPSNRLGAHLSDSAKAKIAEANRRRVITPETRQKLSEAGHGRHPTKATRKKLSESHRRENLSPETRKLLSEAGKRGAFISHQRRNINGPSNPAE